MTHDPILVLGGGYTGRVVRRRLMESSRSCVVTFRNRLPRGDGRGEYLHFDLGKSETWSTLPVLGDVVWTFPAEPLQQVEEFANVLFRTGRRVVVIGTTSAYLPGQADEIVNEATPLDLNSPRVRGEELLRSRGATIVRAAGIYGPARNPLDWLRRGVSSHGSSFVNLIHVEDLAEVLLRVLTSAPAGEHFCASDGTPRQWKDIAAWALERGFLREARFGEGRSSKKISNSKLLALLRRPLDHAHLFHELEILEEERRSRGQT